MAVKMDKNKIKDILERGVDTVIVGERLKKALLSGKKLKIYYGIDPTGALLHLGHSVILRKLQAFAELGHDVILLIGDFTAKIGDPTDKEAIRKPLNDDEIKVNMKTYKKQAEKVLDFSRIKIEHNSKWLSKLNFEDILELASKTSVQRMLERDMFEKRIKAGKTIGLHEFMYPLMQGYDSVAMNVDLEIAGTDQMFNMLVGRDLQKAYNNKEKHIITLKLLLGTDGRKMSKTFDNFIALTDQPNEMYGKIMSMQDELIGQYFELCTDSSMDPNEIAQDPRAAKAKLAKKIVTLYHNEKKAIESENEFNKVFRDKGMPKDIPEFKAVKTAYFIQDLLFEARLALSKGDAKRLIEGGGVSIIIDKEKKKIVDWRSEIKLKNGMIIKVGKRKFIRIKL